MTNIDYYNDIALRVRFAPFAFPNCSVESSDLLRSGREWGFRQTFIKSYHIAEQEWIRIDPLTGQNVKHSHLPHKCIHQELGVVNFCQTVYQRNSLPKGGGWRGLHNLKTDRF